MDWIAMVLDWLRYSCLHIWIVQCVVGNHPSEWINHWHGQRYTSVKWPEGMLDIAHFCSRWSILQYWYLYYISWIWLHERSYSNHPRISDGMVEAGKSIAQGVPWHSIWDAEKIWKDGVQKVPESQTWSDEVWWTLINFTLFTYCNLYNENPTGVNLLGPSSLRWFRVQVCMCVPKCLNLFGLAAKRACFTMTFFGGQSALEAAMLHSAPWIQHTVHTQYILYIYTYMYTHAHISLYICVCVCARNVCILCNDMYTVCAIDTQRRKTNKGWPGKVGCRSRQILPDLARSRQWTIPTLDHS